MPLVPSLSLSYYGDRRNETSEGRMHGVTSTLCSQCDHSESQCTCEKYCCFCQSQYKVRLCVDGLYYCPDCREACDIHVADSDDH
jgi:hypothetical protein